jgi:ParB/RepB/Spo0J family partition protein
MTIQGSSQTVTGGQTMSQVSSIVEKEVASPGPAADHKDGLKDVKDVETIVLADIELRDARFQYRIVTRTSDIIKSLENEGQLAPVILWGKKAPYLIIDGFRRLTAMSEMKWLDVKAIVRRTISEEDAYRISFIENVKRKSFSPMDMANAVWKSQARGKSVDDLEEEFQLSKRQIERYAELLKFAAKIKTALQENQIGMGHAKVFDDFKIDDPSPYFDRIKSGMSAQALRLFLRKENGPPKKTRKYLKKEKDGFRVYPMRFRRDADAKDRAAIVKALKEALELAGA